MAKAGSFDSERWGRVPCAGLAMALTLILGGEAIAQTAAAGGGGEVDIIPTFSRDVAPILQRSCQHCHQPTGIAPMSLLSYREARPWARSIR